MDLKTSSSSHVKWKGVSLIISSGRKMDNKFIKITGKGGEVPVILEQWESKQKELRKLGMEQKEIADPSTDKQRNANLKKPTELGGPSPAITRWRISWLGRTWMLRRWAKGNIWRSDIICYKLLHFIPKSV